MRPDASQKDLEENNLALLFEMGNYSTLGLKRKQQK